MTEAKAPQSETSAINEIDAALASLEDEGPRGGIVAMLARLTATQMLLIVNTGAVAMLAFGVVWLTTRPMQMLPAVQQAEASDGLPAAPQDDEEVYQSASAPTAAELAAAPQTPAERAVSWSAAQAAYTGGDYAAALAQYSALAKLAEADVAAELMRDFLRLRMAICCQQLRRGDEANALLEQAAASKSPVVRAAANYRLAVRDELDGQYLQSRMRAYQSLAAIAAIQEHSDIATDCEFLIARALTRKALSFYGHDRSIHWSELPMIDPLEGLNEAQLKALLARKAGVESEAMLGPRIEQTSQSGQMPLWTATCMRAAVSDVMNIFAAEAELDLQWAQVSDAARGRAVSLHLPDVASQRLCEVAAGCVGLVARFTGETVIVHNPPALESVNDQREVLVEEAISAWRRLFLRTGQDSRLAEGYFALGLLHECSGATIEAINDYQLTAKRFARARVAPASLLRSAGLLSELRDFSSARSGLLELLDRYPDCQELPQAYAALGEATMNAGRYAEAFNVFKKLHFMESSGDSRRTACFGAGKCLYADARYAQAAEWLDRYIALSAGRDAGELAEAYLLLGRSYRGAGDAPRATAAFRQAMAAAAQAGVLVDAGLEAARAYLDAGELARALGALEAASQHERTPAQDYEIHRLTARIYRGMGLPDRASSYLRGTMAEVSDASDRARLAVELGRSYCEEEQYQEAASVIAEALGALGGGAEAHEAACDLAEVCLKLDRPAQAETLADEVLASETTGPLAERARRLLADAHLAREQYDQAAVALAGPKAEQPGGPQQ